MRPVAVFFALMVALALVLSGCLQVPEGADGDGDTVSDDGSDDGTGAGGDDGDPNDDGDGSDGNGGSGDDGDGGDGDGGDGGEGDDDLECHEHDRPQPAHPDEHEVTSEDDLRCPGHYLIHEQGSGESWEVPTWEVGDWWYYEHESYTGTGTQCTHHSNETVIADDEEILGVPIYTIEIKLYDCDGEEYDQDPNTENRSQDTLMTMGDNGFINHYLIFPLSEGKSWTYVTNSCNDGECNQIPVDEVAHVEGDALGRPEMWTSQWSISSDRGTVVVDQEWSVPHKALHYEEYNHDAIAGPLLKKELLDSIFHEEDDDGPLNGPLR